MAILDKKSIGDVESDVLKYLKFFEFPGVQVSLKGSSQFKALKYKSDYDLLISIPRDRKPADVFNNLKTILENIEKDTNIFFIELKLHCKDDKKIRFHKKDPFHFTEFENVYGNLKFFKLDCVMCIKNKLYEVSCLYNFTPEEYLTKQDIIKNINEDIDEYRAEGNYYKVLKRMFSIAYLQQNVALCDFLMRIFNSTLGKTYEQICNMVAIKLLDEYYKTDTPVQRRIKQNLKLLKINAG